MRISQIRIGTLSTKTLQVQTRERRECCTPFFSGLTRRHQTSVRPPPPPPHHTRTSCAASIRAHLDLVRLMIESGRHVHLSLIPTSTPHFPSSPLPSSPLHLLCFLVFLRSVLLLSDLRSVYRGAHAVGEPAPFESGGRRLIFSEAFLSTMIVPEAILSTNSQFSNFTIASGGSTRPQALIILLLLRLRLRS